MRSNLVLKFPRLVLGTALCLTVAQTTAAADRVEPIRDVVYAQRGDLKLLCDVYVPAGEGPYPGVLLIHGGAWRSGSKSQLMFLARHLANSGYAVMAINYRLAPEHKFPAQIEDCKTALRWLRTHSAAYKIDPDRVAAWGYSAGGHLACLLGASDQDDGLEGSDVADGSPHTRIQAVVAGGAPCDFRLMPADAEGLAFWLDGTRRDKPEVYESASPARFVTPDDPPVFFYHGDADELVPLAGVRLMMGTLEKAGVATQLHVVAGAKHVPAALNGDASRAAVEFLDRQLKQPSEALAP